MRLRAALMLAKALAARVDWHGEEEAASLTKMDEAIEAIRKQVEGFEEIRTSAKTVLSGGN